MNGLCVPNPKEAVDTQGRPPAGRSIGPIRQVRAIPLLGRHGSRPAHRAKAGGLYGDLIESSSQSSTRSEVDLARCDGSRISVYEKARSTPLRITRFPRQATRNVRQRARATGLLHPESSDRQTDPTARCTHDKDSPPRRQCCSRQAWTPAPLQIAGYPDCAEGASSSASALASAASTASGSSDSSPSA